MARRGYGSAGTTSDEVNINDSLTPMLDVVFIMLIFFIVTATFIKQAGIEVLRPDALTAEQKPTVAILVAVGPTGEIWIDKKRVDPTSVRAHIERLHAENPKGGMVVQADRKSTNEKLMAVLNAARAAGMREVAISTEK
ncbi:MAG TPA: biopolymer transporter ExbD [Halieaceae bacterium]|jgi:biopolymer transport protein ExbD|nr:MAG: biopolymer transporter ExbD [Gammaproteobacteria bacterium TMED30]OUU03184.1 MAG: biopolymer transporter ExbD [Gammaproteobacteria bacterium TMED30]HCJ39842.1 biopolymer transporter ExbD [Halieaceae bacterium]|tara:strand:- start:225 stop:641 length:417 start_codon:yes stop_codon:yes gene_type:complete